jgi:hypothetical protein
LQHSSSIGLANRSTHTVYEKDRAVNGKEMDFSSHFLPVAKQALGGNLT